MLHCEQREAPPAAGLASFARQVPQIGELARRRRQAAERQLIYGVSGTQKPFLAAVIQQLIPPEGPALYVTPDLQRAREVRADLQAFFPEERVLLFPPRPGFPYDISARSLEVETERLQVLEAALEGRERQLVAPVASLMSYLPPPERLRQCLLPLAVGEEIDPAELARRLVSLGYRRELQAESPGQFAVRGHIVDVFSPAAGVPYRMEFYGNTLESIRSYDPEDQRSRQHVTGVKLFAAREVVVTDEEREKGLEQLFWHLRQAAHKWRSQGKGHLAQRAEEKLRQYQSQADNSAHVSGLEHMLHLFLENPSHLLDMLPRSAPVFLDEPARIREEAEKLGRQAVEAQAELLDQGRVLPRHRQGFLDSEALMEAFNRHSFMALALFQRRVPGLEVTHSLTPAGKEAPVFRGQESLLLAEIRNWISQGWAVVMAVGDEARQEHWRESLISAGLPADQVVVAADGSPRPGRVALVPATLQEGFEWRGAGLVVLAGKNLVGQQRARTRAQASPGQKLRQLEELYPGDLVVHVHHGVGRYVGLESLQVDGVTRDYLLVEYAGSDRLYVPTEQLGLLERYLGGEGLRPRLHRLGGTDWKNTRNKVQRSLEELARDLLNLYAAREAAPGTAFSPDTVWQSQFEEEFPFQETPDQEAAIAAVKKAMEAGQPMEHLVCGDVGFGKTEVAIRAAFKAVMNEKQVALVAPTTVLAQQHWNTMKQRFADYPIGVEMLSRFTTPARQRETLQGLRRGTVDVVVGTHRLLQDDVAFRDLGLLVVDEEQRFGVQQKEALKKQRQGVDVLTLSATPIPRTLHMALAGMRDMSVIETPPEKRQPVQTVVVEHDRALVRQAINQELRREGQVFYVYNRVRGIREEAARLETELPGARIAVAHGQMQERRLEKVFLGFLQREYDVLVCSTIIENGLDLPNVNTLIVVDADHMGLAQLYQLRGRVGRSERQAYAYFTYQPQKVLTAEAEKRLQALREFTQLGSGFRLAMRDLEIRGAGELLGAEQHGHIASVGFALYSRLLENAVREARGEKVAETREPVLDISVSAFLPPDLVPDPAHRIDLYKALSTAEQEDDVAEVERELRDRFGAPGADAHNLLQVARVRVLARAAGMEAITREKGRLQLRWPEGQVPLARLGQNWRGSTRRLILDPSPRARGFALRTGDLEDADLLSLLLEVLRCLMPGPEQESVQRSG